MSGAATAVPAIRNITHTQHMLLQQTQHVLPQQTHTTNATLTTPPGTVSHACCVYVVGVQLHHPAHRDTVPAALQRSM